jgi:protein subunit release factor B
MHDYKINFLKESALCQKMAKLGVKEEDILEKFVLSKGPGGQNVNKTSTCVYLKHLPSGIEVKCGRERSQLRNRIEARKILIDKIEENVLKTELEKKNKREKIKRQSRKRSFKAKQIMLENKKMKSKKKSLRKKIIESSE